jgi:glycerol-3-phosphate O-acyltransferase / dihydroxyacetone phosphate acyltransferase
MIKKVRISVLYAFCFVLVYIGYRIFLKKIKVKGIKNYPKNRPVIIAANHTNAFLDAIIFHFVFFENVYSLARGDIFKSAINRYFLGKFNILPIFRLQEGAHNLHKNEESFEKSIQVLENNKPLLIFPEGNCVQEKRVRNLKKGMARIAFMAEERNNFNLNLCILPVGINYLNFTKFRGELFLNIGKPIDVEEYKQMFALDKQKTISKVSNDVHASLKDLIVVVEEKQNEILYEQLNEILKHKYPSGDYRNIATKFNNWINLIPIEEVKLITSDYFDKLKELKIKDWVVRKNKTNALGYLLLNFVLLFAFSPLFLAGIITNYIPYKFPYWATKKLVKVDDFFLSVNLGIGVFFYLIYHQLFLFIVSLSFDSLFWYFFVGMPLSGYFSLIYLEQFKKFLGVFRFVLIKRQQPKVFEEILNSRKKIIYFWENF